MHTLSGGPARYPCHRRVLVFGGATTPAFKQQRNREGGDRTARHRFPDGRPFHFDRCCARQRGQSSARCLGAYRKLRREQRSSPRPSPDDPPVLQARHLTALPYRATSQGVSDRLFFAFPIRPFAREHPRLHTMMREIYTDNVHSGYQKAGEHSNEIRVLHESRNSCIYII